MIGQLKIREYKKVISLLGEEKRRYFLALVMCAAIDPAFQIIFALVSRKMFNAIEYQSTSLLIQGFILMLSIFLIYCIVQPVAAYHYEGRLHAPMIELRRGLLSHLIKLPMPFFHRYHSGQLMSTLTHDFEEMATFYREYTYDLVATFFLGVGSLVSMLWLDLRLGICMILLSLVTTGVNALFSEKLSDLTRQIQNSVGRSNQQLSTLVSGFRTIKMYHMEAEMAEGYRETTNQIAEIQHERNRILATKSALSLLMSLVNLVGVLSIAAVLVARGSIDFGTAMAVIMLQNGVVTLFASFGTYFSQFSSALGGASRIFEILDEAEEGAAPSRVG